MSIIPKLKSGTPIKKAWITREAGFRTPIDGTSIWNENYGQLKQFCDLFGLEPQVSERFTLHLIDSQKTNDLVGMSIDILRIILYELSERGLDLSKVEGMEDGFRMENG